MPRQDSSATPNANLPISVLLVDDHPAVRAGLRSLLASEAGVVVDGDVESGEEAYAQYRQRPSDVVVMDITMGGYGGIECLRRLRQFDPGVRVLVYTVHTSETMLNRVLSLGGLGYVTKGSDIDVLVAGIRAVARNEGFVSPDMVAAMVRRAGPGGTALPDHLGNRGFEVFLLIAQGHRVGECARILNISPKTVSNHLTQIKQKLNVVNTAELARVAIRAGLVEP